MHGFGKKLYPAILLAGMGGYVNAQDRNPDDVIAGCARIAAVGDRILCLENAVRELANDVEADAHYAAGPEPDSSVRESTQPADDTGGVHTAGSTVSETTTANQASAESTPVAAMPAATSASVAVETAAAIDAEMPHATGESAAAPAADSADAATLVADPASNDIADAGAEEIGAEQVRARAMSQEERLASLDSAENLRVASYAKVPFEKLVVELENGQVWRQIKGDVQKIRVNLKRNQTVTISESRFGGYQLRLNEMQRTIRVQRIR